MRALLLVLLAATATAQPVPDSLAADSAAVGTATVAPVPVAAGAVVADTSAPAAVGAAGPVSALRPDTVRAQPPVPEAAPSASPLEGLVDAFDAELARARESVSTQVSSVQQALSPARLLIALLLLILAAVGITLVGRALSAAARFWPRAGPRLRRAAPFVRFGLWGLAAWMVAGFLFGASSVLVAILALLLLGLAVYALAPVLRDVAAGAVLLLEGRVEAGEHVVVGGRSGRVERVGLRSVRLRLADGEPLAIPNGRVLRQSVVGVPDAARAHRVEVDLPVATPGRARDAALASAFVAAGVPVEALPTPGGGVRVVAYALDAASTAALAADIARRAEGEYRFASSMSG